MSVVVARNALHHGDGRALSSSLLAGTASIVRQSELNEEDSRCEGLPSRDQISLVHLPVGVLLKIMSYLDAPTLCRLSRSSWYLNSIASDRILWRRLLERDIQHWDVIGHLSHPLIYHETTSNLPPKTLYSQCYVHRSSVPTHQSFTYPFTSRLRSLVRRLQGHVSKIILFGSGLESLPFVRKLFWEKDSPYLPIGLYPGRDGVGSGVCIQHGSTPLNLVTLYTATKAERVAQAATDGQPKINKLISPYSDSAGPELTQAVQGLCQQADAFILVINTSNLNSTDRDVDVCLLNAMLQSSPYHHTPLLVVGAAPSESQVPSPKLHPPVQVAEWLGLVHIQHPWQVRSLSLDTFAGFHDGLDWLLQTAQL